MIFKGGILGGMCHFWGGILLYCLITNYMGKARIKFATLGDDPPCLSIALQFPSLFVFICFRSELLSITLYIKGKNVARCMRL